MTDSKGNDHRRQAKSPLGSGMETAPTFSVVTPSYNQSSFIEETLKSVSRQNIEGLEHIIVDGGSTDRTREILAEYESQATHTVRWVSEPDDGQADALNKGFDMADGEFVGWLNSDDVYFHTDVLNRVVEEFRRSDAEVVYGDLAWIDRESTVFHARVRPDKAEDLVAFTNPIMQPATFFRSSVVDRFKLDPSFRYVLDYEYWMRMVQDGVRFRHVDEILAGFRKHDEQKTAGGSGPVLSEKAAVLERDMAMPVWAHIATMAAIEFWFDIRSLGRLATVRNNCPTLAFDGELAPINEQARSQFGSALGRVNPLKPIGR